MRRVGVLSFIFIFLFVSALPVFADEIDQLKGEIQQLMKRLDDLEKKQKESSTKAAEAEKKVEEVAKKTEKIEKKSLKDRIDWGGEIRFRMVTENATTDRNFYGVGQTSSNREWQDKTSFPLRIRLNAHAEAVQDWLDVYARLTMNKRWGAWDSKATDPFNRPNSFEASAGHDMDARFEQAYMTLKLPWINSMWYVVCLYFI